MTDDEIEQFTLATMERAEEIVENGIADDKVSLAFQYLVALKFIEDNLLSERLEDIYERIYVCRDRILRDELN